MPYSTWLLWAPVPRKAADQAAAPVHIAISPPKGQSPISARQPPALPTEFDTN